MDFRLSLRNTGKIQEGRAGCNFLHTMKKVAILTMNCRGGGDLLRVLGGGAKSVDDVESGSTNGWEKAACKAHQHGEEKSRDDNLGGQRK